MSENAKDLFFKGLMENDNKTLLRVPKSDIHNHSTKGCTRQWLQERLQQTLAKPPKKFGGLDGMQEWFTDSIKPYCRGGEGIVIRWEGAFAEAKRNNITRLAMNFGVQEIDLVGGIDTFRQIVEGYHERYCPNTIFEPEITYGSRCNPELEAERMDQYVSSGYFKSIDVCGGENVQPMEAFLPLYRKAEEYHLTKIMHVGESGSAEDVIRAVSILGLNEIHHGIHAALSNEAMHLLADQQIQLNICPSSNVLLGYADSFKEHPIKKLYENGVNVTINTDDLLIFGSSIENEYLLLYRAGALNAMQLNEIRESGLRSRRQQYE